MTPELREKIESQSEIIKKYLKWSHGIYKDPEGKTFISHYRTDSDEITRLATHCLEQEIKILTEYMDSKLMEYGECDLPTWVCKDLEYEINELNSQLKELRGEK